MNVSSFTVLEEMYKPHPKLSDISVDCSIIKMITEFLLFLESSLLASVSSLGNYLTLLNFKHLFSKPL